MCALYRKGVTYSIIVIQFKKSLQKLYINSTSQLLEPIL